MWYVPSYGLDNDSIRVYLSVFTSDHGVRTSLMFPALIFSYGDYTTIDDSPSSPGLDHSAHGKFLR